MIDADKLVALLAATRAVRDQVADLEPPLEMDTDTYLALPDEERAFLRAMNRVVLHLANAVVGLNALRNGEPQSWLELDARA